jgi:hypothetical protein
MSHVYHYVGIILSHSRVSVTRGAKTNVILGLVHGSRRIPLSFMHGFSANWGQCVPTVFFGFAGGVASAVSSGHIQVSSKGCKSTNNRPRSQ